MSPSPHKNSVRKLYLKKKKTPLYLEQKYILCMEVKNFKTKADASFVLIQKYPALYS